MTSRTNKSTIKENADDKTKDEETIKPYNYIGSKDKLLPIIIPRLISAIEETKPNSSCTYIEPFCGSGIVFLTLINELM